MKLIALAAILLCAASAPAQQAKPPQAAPSASGPALTIDPASVTVKRRSSARITITVSVPPADAANVGLVCSLLYDTKMTFEPQVVAGGNGTTTLTIAPGPSAIKGSYTVSITAVAPKGSRVATLQVKIR